jgi:ABC-type polysaccharide/polyol phosphate export permease
MHLFDVRRLGWLYWLGGISSTVFYLSSRYDASIPERGFDFITFMSGMLMLVTVMVALVMFPIGAIHRDRYEMAGSLLGCAMAISPVIGAVLIR